MAEETLTPVSAAEPPKANPLSKPVSTAPATLKLPPKPATGLKPGLKLPPKPTLGGIKPGLKLPSKPVIRKPGSAPTTMSIPKPILPKPVSTAVAAPTPAPAPAAPAPTPAAPAPTPAPAAPQGEGSVATLKAMTQKLKSITQPIPQQAILHKTGMLAETALTDAQKQAAKSKTSRISLSEAIGVAPVKNDAAPMKTIRIKRPVDLPKTVTPAPAATAPAATSAPAAPASIADSTTVTQRKTLKITRPNIAGGAKPAAPKFGVKKPTTATTAQTIAAPAPVADIADIPEIADIPDIQPVAAAQGDTVADVPKAVATASLVVQLAACGVAAALVWALYQSWILPLVCGGCAV